VSPEVTAIVVHLRGRELLGECLRSLRAALADLDAEIVLVDNASDDGSRDLVRSDHRDVRLVELDSNRGFAGGVNAGLAASAGRFVLTLNDDATIAAGAVEHLLSALRADERAAAAAAQMRFSSAPEIVNSAGISVDRLGVACDRLLGSPAADGGAPEEVFGASAGAALYRRAALEDAGGFDEGFHSYLEDVDLAWRLRMGGWRALYVPAAVVMHHHSATARHGSQRKHYQVGRNRMRLLARNMEGRHLRRWLPAIVAYELAHAGYATVADRTLAPVRGRAAGLREWRAQRHAGAARRRAVRLDPAFGVLAALARRRAWQRWSFAAHSAPPDGRALGDDPR
jgi:GT2 family glycosyltransferase